MTHALWTAVVHAFRRMALPLTSYYVVTLAIPLVNGAARTGAGLVGHVLTVLVVPPAAIVIACAVQMVSRVLLTGWRSCSRQDPRRHRGRFWINSWLRGM